MEQKKSFEYKIIDYQRPYRDYTTKIDKLDRFAKDGWELVCTSIIPMGISDDKYIFKWLCTECGNTIPFVSSDHVPKFCVNDRCRSESIEKITVITKKVWCIEHFYLRREKEEKKGEDNGGQTKSDS